MSGSDTRVWAGGVATAHAALSWPMKSAGERRAELLYADGKPFPVKHVKHADEQTTVALAALSGVLRANQWDTARFDGWTIIGAPRFLGRNTTAETVHQFLADARYSVSPNIIPNQSLHAPSGTFSVVLGVRGPNFGVGGGVGHLNDGLIAAISALQDERCPGVLLILSCCDPEPIPDKDGNSTNDPITHAAVLTLARTGEGLAIRLTNESSDSVGDLTDFLAFLNDPAGKSWKTAQIGLGSIEVSRS